MCSKASRCYSCGANDAPGTVHVGPFEGCTSIIVDFQTAKGPEMIESTIMTIMTPLVI